MSDELISKDKILKTIREWTNEYIPQTLYGDGYDDAVKDIIKLIETEIPVNAVELPCNAGSAICVLNRSGEIKETKVLDFIVSEDDVYLYICGYGYYSSDYINDLLFFSREEAEAALKKRIGGAE